MKKYVKPISEIEDLLIVKSVMLSVSGDGNKDIPVDEEQFGDAGDAKEREDGWKGGLW